MKQFFFIYTFFLFILTFSVFGQEKIQGIPIMANYSRADYNGGRQNWEIAQNKDGILFLANNNGVLEFDGNFWRLIPVENKSVVRSVAIDSRQRVYVGASNEIGYLETDNRAEYVYVSLVEKLPKRHRNFGEVWDIFIVGKDVYFLSFTYMFRLRDNEIEVLIKNSKLYFSYLVENEVFIQDKEKGLLKYDGFEFEAIKGTKQFSKQYDIWAFHKLNADTFLIGTDHDGLFLLHNDTITPWNVNVNDFLKKNQIFSSIETKNGDFVFGTIQNGFIQMNRKGEILGHLNKTKGLANNTVLSLFIDKDDVLWLGLDNGLACVQIHQPISLIGESMGVYGAGYASLISKDKIYLGTNQGLFVSDFSQQSNLNDYNFHLVKGTSGQVWNITQVENAILCGHTRGSFYVKNNEVQQITDRKGVWTFLPLKEDKSLIVVGLYDGLALFKQTKTGVEFLHRIEGFSESSRTLLEDDFGNIWMAHGYKGIFKIRLNNQRDSVVSAKLYNQLKGLPAQFGNELFEFRGAFGVSTQKGIYSFSYEKDQFIPTYKYNDLFGHNNLKYAIEDRTGVVWGLTDKGLNYFQPTDNGAYQKKQNILALFNNRLIPAFESFELTSDNDLILSYDDGFIVYDNRKISKNAADLKTYIREMSVLQNGKDSLIYAGEKKSDEIGKIELKHHENALRFLFSMPSFGENSVQEYAVRLKGLSSDWSFWQTEPFKEYSNLSYGEYTFQVKSRTISEFESDISELTFRILPPWYYTSLAYGLYFVFLLGLLFFAYKMFQKKIKRERIALKKRQKDQLQQQKEHFTTIKLQQEKELISLRNEKLQAEIKQKNQENDIRNIELSSVTMQITHKNEILNNLKNKIDKVSKSVNVLAKRELEALVYMIESDLDLDGDWDRFEKHFELVHKGFFKRLRSGFPELTTNDLKMCAYLRMNLTSKEISPLMNISLRSVENGRYRLRKKFNLDKEENLVEFIMQV